MISYNYPIRVLYRKLADPNYEPFAVDCSTGQRIELPKGTTGKHKHILKYVVAVILTVLVLYLVVLSPVYQTTVSRYEADKLISSLNTNEIAVVNRLKKQGEILSKTTQNSAVTIHLKVDKSKVDETLAVAFSLPSLKEVTTDGDTIAITFMSSSVK